MAPVKARRARSPLLNLVISSDLERSTLSVFFADRPSAARAWSLGFTTCGRETPGVGGRRSLSGGKLRGARRYTANSSGASLVLPNTRLVSSHPVRAMTETRIDAKAALVFIINYRVLTLSLTLSSFFCTENNESTINTAAPRVIKLSAALKAGQ